MGRPTVVEYIYKSQLPQTYTTRCVPPFVLYTNVDVQCDKLVAVVGRTKLRTLATIDVLWRLKSSKIL